MRQCSENANEAQKALIDKCEVSDDKKEIQNEVANRWNTCGIKYRSQESKIWFNALYILDFKLKEVKEKMRKMNMTRRHMYLMPYQKNTNL